jgi:uncharacterized protein (TIGR03437 family)
LNGPLGVAADTAGNLYIADTGNNRIRMVTPGGAISTIAGNGGSGSGGDGFAAASAPLSSPQGVAVDAAGNLYIAEAGRNTLRKVVTDGTITTLAGTGSCCYSGDGGPAIAAALNAPWGLAVDPAGDIYFGDYGNNAVRAIGVASAIPTIATVTNGASNRPGAIAPGELVVVYGSGLGAGQIAQPGGSAVTQIGGVSVLFNGVPGQMVYAFPGQASAVAPAGLAGPNVQVVVTNRNFASGAVTAPLAAASPALFTGDSSGAGQAAATNADGSLNSATNPASAGSTLTLLATGTGNFQPSVTVGGLAATVVSVTGAAPGVVALAVQMPAGLSSGSAPVLIGAGGVSSPGGVTVAVK